MKEYIVRFNSADTQREITVRANADTIDKARSKAADLIAIHLSEYGIKSDVTIFPDGSTVITTIKT